MRKLLHFVVFVLVLAVVMPFYSLEALGATEETGFVEYQTEASINFEEIVEVVLVNEDTGHYYTHKLYRINDYAGNFSVPVGTYSVSAKVITEYEEELSQYDVVCLTEKINVTGQNIAVAVKLRVDEFALGDVSGGAWGEAGPGDFTNGDWTIPEESAPNGDGTPETDPGSEPEESFGATEVIGQTEPAVDDNHSGGSLLGSFVVSVLAIGVGGVALWLFYKYKEG